MPVPQGTMPSALHYDCRWQAQLIKQNSDRLQWFTVVNDEVDWAKSGPYDLQTSETGQVLLLRKPSRTPACS